MDGTILGFSACVPRETGGCIRRSAGGGVFWPGRLGFALGKGAGLPGWLEGMIRNGVGGKRVACPGRCETWDCRALAMTSVFLETLHKDKVHVGMGFFFSCLELTVLTMVATVLHYGKGFGIT